MSRVAVILALAILASISAALWVGVLDRRHQAECERQIAVLTALLPPDMAGEQRVTALKDLNEALEREGC